MLCSSVADDATVQYTPLIHFKKINAKMKLLMGLNPI
jgi:hypothetical protein